MSKTSIPKFGLYGEDSGRLHPGFVHIENIAERSRQHDWTIEPHRHGKLFQLLYLDNGKVNVRVDEASYALEGHWVICIPSGTVHGFSFPADTQGQVLTVVETFMQTNDSQIQPYLDQMTAQPGLIEFSAKAVLLDQFRQYLNLIREEISQAETAHSLMLKWLVNIVFVTLFRQQENTPQPDQKGPHFRKLMVNRFRQLLESNYRQHWNVQQYAQALHTSASTLNRHCSEQIGANAKGIIQERLLIEIKRRLIYTRDSLDNIAYHLGYKDPSYFSRFFKKLEGLSPTEYRQKKYNETETTL